MARPTTSRKVHLDRLPTEDVRVIVRLLGEVAGLAMDAPGKRRFLMQGLAKLLDADFWGWVHFRDHARAIADGVYDRRWWMGERSTIDEVGEASFTPAALQLKRATYGLDRTCTGLAAGTICFWTMNGFPSDLVQHYYEPAGIGEFLSSLYPLGENIFSSIVFAGGGRAAFSRRKCASRNLLPMTSNWLHRAGTDVPAVDHVNELSIRQRLVLAHLMTGNGTKQIARKLSISAYTVNDHIKTIYQRFGVRNRAELLAQFLAGGASTNRTQARSTR